MEPQICSYLSTPPAEVARFLEEEGYTDNVSRMLSWLKIRNLISGDQHIITDQLIDIVLDYEEKNHLEEKFVFEEKEFDAFDNYLDRNPHLRCDSDFEITDSLCGLQINMTMLTAKEWFSEAIKVRFSDPDSDEIRKDVLRIFPHDKFFRLPSTMCAVFRLTKCLLEDNECEHCEGFDDFGGICYQICFNALNESNALHVPALYELIHRFDREIVSEAIAFVLYKEFFSIVKNLFHDLTEKEREVWTQINQVLNEPEKALELELELREEDFMKLNLSQSSFLILRTIFHTNKVVYDVLRRVEAPLELLMCRLIRTLFSRDLKSDELAKIWDFILADDTIFQNGFTIVGEIAAIILILNLCKFNEESDVLDVEEELFRVEKDTIPENFHYELLVYLKNLRKNTCFDYLLPIYLESTEVGAEVMEIPSYIYKPKIEICKLQGYLELSSLYRDIPSDKFNINHYEEQIKTNTKSLLVYSEWLSEFSLQLHVASLLEEIEGALSSDQIDDLLVLAEQLSFSKQQMLTEIDYDDQPSIFPQINTQLVFDEAMYLLEELIAQINESLQGADNLQKLKRKYSQVYKPK